MPQLSDTHRELGQGINMGESKEKPMDNGLKDIFGATGGASQATADPFGAKSSSNNDGDMFAFLNGVGGGGGS